MANMRYCEIPRDVSCTDSFATLRFCKSKKSALHSTSLNLEPEEDIEEYGGVTYVPSPAPNESPTRAHRPPHTPTTECWRKKKTSVTETALPSYETLKATSGDDSTASTETSSDSGRSKSQSLPCHSSLSCLDSSLLSALRLSPEDLASQLTLLDLAVFKQIRPEELTSCAWNTRHKREVAPSVVAFTRRFNHVSFWAVQEILNCVPIKLRAETLAHFIRVAKKLFELTNFHSLFAIISALQSASVYRLTKTWSQLTKKDRLTFEKLANVFSDQNNWENLREHVESLKLPCIPYLGMFLTDLVYIDMAHPSTGGLESAQRRSKMNNILRIIAHLQASSYEDLPSLPHIQHHLKSIRYIEELQKFVEDDQYKLSLKLEPNPISHEAPPPGKTPPAPLSLSPLRFHAPVSKFVPGHRKCHSLGTSFQFIRAQEPRHLLDDSVLEVTFPPTPPLQVHSLLHTARPHINPFNRDDSVVLQGCLRRKTIMKDGRRPTVSSWQRYWVQLWASTLVYYPPRSFKGHERSDFKREPCKMSHVQGCTICPGEQPDLFLFQDPLKCSQYKFKADTPELVTQWIILLQQTAQSFLSDSKTPMNLISFE